MRYSYFYFMKDDPGRVRAVVPEHAAYWQGLELPDYRGGPFTDRDGGLITFTSDSDQDAKRLVANDPFLREGLLRSHWLKEWEAA